MSGTKKVDELITILAELICNEMEDKKMMDLCGYNTNPQASFSNYNASEIYHIEVKHFLDNYGSNYNKAVEIIEEKLHGFFNDNI